MKELVVGAFSPSILLRVAEATGRLGGRGLVVREVPVASSPEQFRSLIRGDLDAVLTSPDNVVAYRFVPNNPLGATADVAIVSAVDRGLGLGLYGGPHLTTDAQLRGSTIAVDVATSGFAFVLFALLESIHLTRADYELVELGSTPRRLEALLAGTCDATMLNAGNELRAEAHGCRCLGRVADVASPYLGTVLGIAGRHRLPDVAMLVRALRDTAAAISSGKDLEITSAEAVSGLGLSADLAARYVDRLKNPREGLVPDGLVDLESMTNVVELRRRHLPAVVDGRDLLLSALVAESGLLLDVDVAGP